MQKNAEIEAEAASLDDLAALGGAGDPEEGEARTAVYEVGYHLLPTVPENELTAAVKALHDFLAENGAQMVGDRFPARVHLAYTITKRIAGKIERFTDAEFGWVAFEMPRDKVAPLHAWLTENPLVLRFLIVTTTRDAVAASLAGPVVHVAPVTGNIEKPKREAEAGGEVSDVALDEALQTIEKEDTVA